MLQSDENWQAPPGQQQAWTGRPAAVPLRVVAIHKSEQAAEKARQDYIYNQRRKQKPICDQTLYLQYSQLNLENYLHRWGPIAEKLSVSPRKRKKQHKMILS